MSLFKTPKQRFTYIMNDAGIKQVTLADASGLSTGGISDMLKNNLSFKAVVGMKILKPNVNVNWIISGQGGPYLDTTGAYLDSYLDQSKLIQKINEIETRLSKLEENAKNKG